MQEVTRRHKPSKHSTTYRARTRHPWRGRKESVVIFAVVELYVSIRGGSVSAKMSEML